MDQRSLHLERLREAVDTIPSLGRKNAPAHDAAFKLWKDRALQSLTFLWGKDHDYTRRFTDLRFWHVRQANREWDQRDERRFQTDAYAAEEILEDSLEELGVAPTQAAHQPTVQSRAGHLPVTVNVTNILSQATSVNVDQVLAALGELKLTPQDRRRAEGLARDLEEEARGRQRWPVLAHILEAIKALGKPAYEKLAIPLLLEMLKQQVGR